MLIAVVYDSGYGHTEKLAHAVLEGTARVSGTEGFLVPVANDPIPWERLEQCDAIIFGSPTYNGLISARLKAFFEASTKAAWNEMTWRNKIAAGFTNSGALHGDKLNALVSMALFAAQHGMVWVGLDLKPGHPGSAGHVPGLNRLGSWLGAMAQSDVEEGPEVTPPECDLLTAAYLGERVATLTSQFNK
jgi:NAD(P)H dehydrogenase (quinone)